MWATFLRPGRSGSERLAYSANGDVKRYGKDERSRSRGCSNDVYNE